MEEKKNPKVKTELFNFGPWHITASTGPILTSVQDDDMRAQLDLPALPEMCFGDTKLEVKHSQGFGLSFNAMDALRRVDNKKDTMKVAYAAEWQKERQSVQISTEVAKPFDWTYTTDFSGTVLGEDKVQVGATTDKIDIEKLKRQEKIHFYQDMMLFEDELADNGIAKLTVKMRVMPSSFFILLRFFLRVDDVLIRINDTRVYHEAGTDFILSEFSSKEKMMNKMRNPHGDENVVAQELDLVTETFTKIQFSENTT